jgi:hypothetical protein
MKNKKKKCENHNLRIEKREINGKMWKGAYCPECKKFWPFPTDIKSMK